MLRYRIHWPGILHRHIILITLTIAIFNMGNVSASFGQQQEFHNIVGDWVRLDGGYVIRVNDILPNGIVQAAYFNPASIHVSESRVSMWKGLVRLFIKLDDKGYPGSTYTLFYHTEKDALAGFYFQAELEQNFEVVFLRKTTN